MTKEVRSDIAGWPVRRQWSAGVVMAPGSGRWKKRLDLGYLLMLQPRLVAGSDVGREREVKGEIAGWSAD